HQHEEMLFAEMSTNQELRNELKELLALNGALQSDVKAFVPPVESTMKIFNTLGYTAPIAAVTAATVAANAGSSGAISSFFAKAGTYIGGYIHALLSGVVITATSLAVLFGTDTIQFSSDTQSVQSSAMASKQYIPQTQSPINTESNTNTIQTDTRNTVKETVRYVYISSPTQQSSGNSGNQAAVNQTSLNVENQASDIQNRAVQEESMIPSAQESATVTTTETLAHSSAQSPTSTWGNITQVQVNDGPLSVPYGMNNSSYLNTPPDQWTLQFRRLDMQTANNNDLMPQSSTFPFNGALTALYTVSPDFAIGLEMGYERFAQTFESVNAQNRRIEVYQQPNLLTAGLALRYTPLRFDNITPYLQASAGFSQIGMVNRASVGFMYAPNQTLSFTLGIESSMLQYKEKNTSYSSFNYGLSYGLSIHL
ncbi:MAG TPA: hypothetical protein PLQ21_00825, partial [Candidatus Kapabacteria bacterium]|nr:hypothetical protein [Candidatus Kapabacteria bacterium]